MVKIKYSLDDQMAERFVITVLVYQKMVKNSLVDQMAELLVIIVLLYQKK